MKLLLGCPGPGPTGVIDTLVWDGDLPWPAPPRSGDKIRVPTSTGPDFAAPVLVTKDVLFEQDGTIYVTTEPVDEKTHQKLRFTYNWRPYTEPK